MIQRLFLCFVLTLSFAVHSSPLLDRQYQLHTLGILLPTDNVDGILSTYTQKIFTQASKRKSRFLVRDLSQANQILDDSKLPPASLYEDREILREISRVTQADSFLRTKIQKKQRLYQFHVEWIHALRFEKIAQVDFSILEPEEGGLLENPEFQKKLEDGLEELWSKVPFLAQITGRDGNTITLNLGTQGQVRAGDTLVVGTLEEVKKHPLLQVISEWKFEETGRAQILETDEKISFAKIVEEKKPKTILRDQKILKVFSASQPSYHDPYTKEEKPSSFEERTQPNPLDESPSMLGWVSGSIPMGTYDRSYSQGTTVSKDGSGLAFGLNLSGELWITNSWHAFASTEYLSLGYTQDDQLTQTTSSTNFSASLLQIKIAGGYYFLPPVSTLSPKAYARVGYQSNSYSLTTVASEYTSNTSYTSFFIGLGGEIPLHESFGVKLFVDYGLLKSAEESISLSPGTQSSIQDLGASLLFYYQWKPKLRFQFGIDVKTHGMDFESTQNSSLRQTVLSATPGIVYYF